MVDNIRSAESINRAFFPNFPSEPVRGGKAGGCGEGALDPDTFLGGKDGFSAYGGGAGPGLELLLRGETP